MFFAVDENRRFRRWRRRRRRRRELPEILPRPHSNEKKILSSLMLMALKERPQAIKP